MSQITWRAPDGLVGQVRAAAAQEGASMNEWITRLVTTAFADDEADPPGARLRARLRAAGLLAPDNAARPPAQAVPADRLAAARKAAGQGTSLSDLVAKGRG